jgi:FAD/FMN-containing dehydrogenase
VNRRIYPRPFRCISPPMLQPDPHATDVAQIAAAVRERTSRGEAVHIHKGGVHHFVPLPGDRRFTGAAVDISMLNRILRIDPEARTCTAEPGVTFAELVKATLAHRLIPAVVPELEGITVGGAVAGCSVEAMSYVHGGFHDTCTEYEVVSGAGEILTLCQDDPLFHMIHGSYGTLAILTRLTFRLVPAAPFVKLEYRTLPTAEAFDAELRARCAARDYDFIDGIIHGPGELVLCLGKFVESAPPGRVSDYRWLHIYYKSTRERSEDYLTTEDYCFRYDTECHWLTRTLPPLEWKPVRFAVGKFVLGSTNLIKWSGILAPILGMKKRPDVVVDVFIPSRRFVDFLRWYEKDFAYYPLWIVPYRIPSPYPWIADSHAARFQDEMFIDCAVYGKTNGDPDVDWSQVLEEKTYELGGIKTLISRNHHTEEKFWQVYNRPNYQAAKQRLDPKGIFPGVYEKFHRKS